MSSNRILGILVVYSKINIENSICVFEKIILKLGYSANIIIINNSNHKIKNRRNLIIIDGDNSLREFSGWNSGLSYAKSKGITNSGTLVIFANDTFCHHNKFGPITKFFFKKNILKLLDEKKIPALLGEVISKDEIFEINKMHFSNWVQTYFFAMNGLLLERLGSTTPNINIEDFFNNESKLVSGPLNDKLELHITNWLTDVKSRSKWYGAREYSIENRAYLVGKAKSILLEKNLSARVIMENGVLISVFENKITKQLRRLEKLFEFLIK